MPRPLRHQAAGAYYHVTQRGTARGPIFQDENDYVRFTALLDITIARYDLELHASCLMPNHFHLVLRTNKPNISRAMQYLVGRYARQYNERHLRVGHLIQGRFNARVIESEAHLYEAIRYVRYNPVAAGLCDRVAQWRWTRPLEDVEAAA